MSFLNRLFTKSQPQSSDQNHNDSTSSDPTRAIEINYEPHSNAITKAGRSHFASRFSLPFVLF